MSDVTAEAIAAEIAPISVALLGVHAALVRVLSRSMPTLIDELRDDLSERLASQRSDAARELIAGFVSFLEESSRGGARKT